MTTQTFSDQLAIEQVGPDEYISEALPIQFGNATPIAYGGCALAVATRAACATVPSTHHLYSVVGHFLGPASLKEKLRCLVSRTRDTKSFVTRRVQILQLQADGKSRLCVELLADFHVLEDASLLAYSAPPMGKYQGPETGFSMKTVRDEGAAQGIDEKTITMAATMLRTAEEWFETKICRESVSAQNVYGFVKQAKTTQDALPITSKTSAEWERTREPLGKTRDEQAAALAFFMDRGLPLLPLLHSHMWFDDTTACSTLDFALRVFSPGVDLTDWHLRERTTTAAGIGRTYSEGRLWNREGCLVASMTQQCILRAASKTKL